MRCSTESLFSGRASWHFDLFSTVGAFYENVFSVLSEKRNSVVRTHAWIAAEGSERAVAENPSAAGGVRGRAV